MDSLLSSRGSRRRFCWGYPALLVGYPLSSSWWSCGKLVFSSRGSCLLVGYPFILVFHFGFLAIFWVGFGFRALAFGFLTFSALGLSSRSATALPAMDNVRIAALRVCNGEGPRKVGIYGLALNPNRRKFGWLPAERQVGGKERGWPISLGQRIQGLHPIIFHHYDMPPPPHPSGVKVVPS